MDGINVDEKLSGSISRRQLAACAVKAVGVWFRAQDTGRYLYLMRNDPKHPLVWGLPGGKVEAGETLLGGMERECMEELGSMPDYIKLIPIEKFTSADGLFEYNTWICVVASEFQPRLNDEHLGYAWIDSGSWPRPMHPGLWNLVNFDDIQAKLSVIEQTSI
jgi:8-oxo-dGTP pyrophosphatase MutT (NUDIX family)